MVNIPFLKRGIPLPFGGRKNSEAEADQTATTTSSTTDITSQAGLVDPEKANPSKTPASPVQTETTETEAETPTASKNRWPLWVKLAIAGCTFAIIAGLAIGLGVGLTRHKHSSNHKDESAPVGGSDNGQGGSPQKRSKLAVYWGAKLNTVSLDTVCEDPSYDIVNLAFLSAFFANGQYPRLVIPSLNGSSEAQKRAGAVDLQDGTPLVPAIQKCQANGKLVLLSMGGAAGYANVKVGSDALGQQVADTIWDLFLGGGKKREIRPFGEDVILDGIDFDNESGQSTGYEAMATQFRSHFASDTSKRYYMTSTPQCPFTADEEELRLFQHLDYVSVQFYNNNVCNVGQPGFEASVRRWSQALGNTTTLLVGALASDADKDQGYVAAGAFKDVLGRVKAMKLPNYGGVMLWEAGLATQNGNYQKKIKSEL